MTVFFSLTENQKRKVGINKYFMKGEVDRKGNSPIRVNW